LKFKEINSSKSWARLPRYQQQQGKNNYVSTSSSSTSSSSSSGVSLSKNESLPATNEFESYTRTFITSKMNDHLNATSDYGFSSSCDSSCSPNQNYTLNLLSINNERSTSTLAPITTTTTTTTTGANIQRPLYLPPLPIHRYHHDIIQDEFNDDLNLIILNKLAKCSRESPGNVPLLCAKTFSKGDFEWKTLKNRLSLDNNKKIQNYLIEIVKGMPVNAQFYITDYDLIFIKTADEQQGYVPRIFLRAIKNIYDNNENNVQDNDSIKYHSLSLSPSDKVNYEHLDNQIDNNQNEYSCLSPSSTNIDSKSLNDYQDLATISNDSIEEVENQIDLVNLKKGSRLPISIKSSLNLSLMDKKLETPTTGAAIRRGEDHFEVKSCEFGRIKARRSLDLNAIRTNSYSNNNEFTIVPINFEDDLKVEESTLNLFPDLDVRQIELDSMRDKPENKLTNAIAYKTNTGKQVNKVWTVILSYKASSFQAIDVVPGMLVFVITEYDKWLYVKVIDHEKEDSNTLIKQQTKCGIIPRSCAVDLEDLKKDFIKMNRNQRRKSQITAI
jgi:hypothetical protein